MKKPTQPGFLPMILRRLPRAVTAQRVEAHQHLHLAPRLNFTVLASMGVGPSTRVERVLAGDAGERVLRREELVERVARQGVRTEPSEPGAAPGPSVAPLSPVFASRPVPAVLLRASAPAVAPETSTPAISHKAWPFPAPTQSLPMDVNRLADQVIQQIDRRLQAHRERTGRR